MGDDDTDDLEEEIESLAEKLAQILHILNKFLSFLVGEELVKLFYAASTVLILFILVRFCLCHSKKKPVTKSLQESDNGDSLDSSVASEDTESLGWFAKYRLRFCLES
ncbi:hypothetical protein KFK09_002066 [Dendrobium nobile]|uniref:Uncharacterized protein n=1 Tax=Dendrobium nobile TaxID=94219 RepID=A0A8T3CA10_DENNO|nr:hypothetical protein KFK09_002066 [Dendrobium nobile]